MRKAWVAVAVALVLAAAGWGISCSNFGTRVIRHLDRRFGWTEAGRQARFDALWAEAQAQYEAQRPKETWGFYRAEYPAKAQLLQQADATLARLATAADLTDFAADLMVSLGREQAGPLIAAYLDRAECDSYSTLPGALAGLYRPDELKQIVLTHPAPMCQAAAWGALTPEGQDPEFLRQVALAYREDLPWYAGFSPEFQSAVMSVYDQLGTRSRIFLVQRTPPQELSQDWLARETDPAVRQQMLYQLRDQAGWVAAIEQDGAFQANGFWDHWAWEREAAANYPDSFLARGIRAYEAVRGKPYFAWDRRTRLQDRPDPWEYGNDQYAPDREIPGWEAFLTEYSRHEAAGYAAYRLGRCYEITEQYDKALKTLKAATTLPSAEMAYHARGRIAWILDALLDEQQLAALDLPELQTAIDYSLAVRKLRTGRYAEALGDLDRLLARGGEAPPTVGSHPFWVGVKAQRAKADTLYRLTGDQSPAGQYQLAAAIFHDELIFYNYLWGGTRTGYLSMYGGHGLEALAYGDMSPAYSRWISQFNNYIQAAQAFATLEEAPGPVGEQALYSHALSLLKLERGYGEDVALWRPEGEIYQEAVGLLERLVREHPQSDLADDALLSLGYLKHDESYFDRIRREYPNADAKP